MYGGFERIMGVTRSYSYSRESISSAVSGYRAGYPQRAISQIIGIPRSTLRTWLTRYRDGRIVYVDPGEHAHYWVLPPPDGPVTPGICKICFTSRDFHNSNGNEVGYYGRKKSEEEYPISEEEWYEEE
jgi:hypothetical protein